MSKTGPPGPPEFLASENRSSPAPVELVRLRASQINGCAYCVDLHDADARDAGETPRRLANLALWRETPFFSDRQQAALEWTEALTLIADTHAPDEAGIGSKPTSPRRGSSI